jgi:hypothetical protein
VLFAGEAIESLRTASVVLSSLMTAELTATAPDFCTPARLFMRRLSCNEHARDLRERAFFYDSMPGQLLPYQSVPCKMARPASRSRMQP